MQRRHDRRLRQRQQPADLERGGERRGPRARRARRGAAGRSCARAAAGRRRPAASRSVRCERERAAIPGAEVVAAPCEVGEADMAGLGALPDRGAPAARRRGVAARRPACSRASAAPRVGGQRAEQADVEPLHQRLERAGAGARERPVREHREAIDRLRAPANSTRTAQSRAPSRRAHPARPRLRRGRDRHLLDRRRRGRPAAPRDVRGSAAAGRGIARGGVCRCRRGPGRQRRGERTDAGRRSHHERDRGRATAPCRCARRSCTTSSRRDELSASARGGGGSTPSWPSRLIRQAR